MEERPANYGVIRGSITATILFGQSWLTHTPSYDICVRFNNKERSYDIYRRYYLCDTPQEARKHAIEIKKVLRGALCELRDCVKPYERFMLRNVWYDAEHDAFRYRGRVHDYSAKINIVR